MTQIATVNKRAKAHTQKWKEFLRFPPVKNVKAVRSSKCRRRTVLDSFKARSPRTHARAYMLLSRSTLTGIPMRSNRNRQNLSATLSL